MRPAEDKWSVQAEIFHPDRSTDCSSDRRAGFVDLSVLIETPQYLAVHCFDSDRIGRIFNKTYDYDTRTTAAEKLAFFAPTWRVSQSSTHRVWYDVWASLPSISDLLQHLKSLHALNNTRYRHADGRTHKLPGSASTVLVVPDIPETAKAIIENEGFRVIKRAHYEKIINRRSS